MAYFATDDSVSSDDFLARLEAKINSIGISSSPSPTHEEEDNKIAINPKIDTLTSVSPVLQSPASVGALLEDDLGLDGIPGFEDGGQKKETTKENAVDGVIRQDDMTIKRKKCHTVDEQDDLSFLLTPELKKTSKKQLSKQSTSGVRPSNFEAKTINGGENDKRSVQQSIDSEGGIKEPDASVVLNKQSSESEKGTLHAKSFSEEDCFDQHSVYHPRYLSNFLTGKINCMGTNSTPQKRESWQTIFNASGIKKRYQNLRSANDTEQNLSYQMPTASRTPLRIIHQPGKLRQNDPVRGTIELKHSRGQSGTSKKNKSEINSEQNALYSVKQDKNVHNTIHECEDHVSSAGDLSTPRITDKYSRKCKTSTSVKNLATSVAKFRSQAKRGTASPFTTPGPHRSSKAKAKITPKHQYLKKRSGVKGKRKDGKVRRMSWKERSLRKHKNPNLARSHKKLNEAEKSILRTSDFIDDVSSYNASHRIYIKAPVSKFRQSFTGMASTGSTADNMI